MKGNTEDDPALWIQPQDKLGRPIDPRLLTAAQRNWKRVQSYAVRHGQDTSRAAEVLEATVHSLSSLIRRHPHFAERIKSLDDYVFGVAAHGLNRLAAKEPTVEYIGSLDDLNSLQGAHDSSWASRLEKELVLKETTGYMNERARHLFSLREMGYSWEEIARNLGTTANNVQSQFSQGVARARRRILGRLHVTSNPTPEPGRSE